MHVLLPLAAHRASVGVVSTQSERQSFTGPQPPSPGGASDQASSSKPPSASTPRQRASGSFPEGSSPAAGQWHHQLPVSPSSCVIASWTRSSGIDECLKIPFCAPQCGFPFSVFWPEVNRNTHFTVASRLLLERKSTPGSRNGLMYSLF